MPGRQYTVTNSTAYRYGFNGQEKSTEIDPNGNLNTAEFWEYDGRIGRRWNVDPLTKKYPWQSPYTALDNNPINKTDPNGDGPPGGDPPIKVGASIGLRIGVGNSGLNFNLTASIGLQGGGQNFKLALFGSGSVYGGSQLGTPPKASGVQTDISFGTYATLGKGTGTPRNFYTLNYNTPSPFKNTSDLSVSFGQLVTRNSAINSRGDGPGFQAEGIFGVRGGNNFMLSTNNDAKSAPYFSGIFRNSFNIKGTDAGWTGGITLNAAGVEGGYQNFSGYRLPQGKDDLNWGVKGYKYPQTDFQKSLNKASTYLQVSNARAEYFGAAWFQNFIHNNISKESTYDYNYQNKAAASEGVQQ